MTEASNKPGAIASGSQVANRLNTSPGSVGQSEKKKPNQYTEDRGLEAKEQREPAQSQNTLATSSALGVIASRSPAFASGSEALASVSPDRAECLNAVSRSIDLGVEALQGDTSLVAQQIGGAQGHELDAEQQKEAIQQIKRFENDLDLLKSRIHDFYLVFGAQLEYLVQLLRQLQQQANSD